MEQAILTTALLKRLGAGYIVARAASALYAQILRDVGADRTVLIEEQMADQVAKTMVAPDIINQLQLSSGHSLIEMKPLREMVGKKLGELDVRHRYRVNIIAIKKRIPFITEDGESSFKETTNDVPGPDDKIESGDVLVVVGADEEHERFAQSK